jgi:hypothetical protein
VLASIFGKFTASLGKTYVYAGLVPAGMFLVFLAAYYTTLPTLFGIAQSLLTSEDSWKAVASFGAIWILLAFLLHAVRAPIFSLFEVIPTGWLGRRLLFGVVKRRNRLTRERIELEWRSTAMLWLRKLDLDRSKIGEFPAWIVRPRAQDAIDVAKCGRETLRAVDLTAGDALNLTVSRSDAIADGIFALYLTARTRHEDAVERDLGGEIEAWRYAAASKQAAAVLESVEQDIKRRFTRAFLKCRRFGKGANIFPTELGNRISALDDYAQNRYGIDTATMWDRLWWILPKEAKDEVSDARLALEALTNLAIALLVAGLVLPSLEIASCGMTLDVVGQSCNGIRIAAFAGVAFALAFLTYRGATFAMEILSIKMTTLIDMYRLAMLRQFGFAAKTVGDELEIYAELRGFFVQASKLDESRPLVDACESGKSTKRMRMSLRSHAKRKRKKEQTVSQTTSSLGISVWLG